MEAVGLGLFLVRRTLDRVDRGEISIREATAMLEAMVASQPQPVEGLARP